MRNSAYPANRIKGQVKVFRVYPDDSWKLVETKRNLIVYGAADILPRVLTGDMAYRINNIFFEFQNLTNPTDSITAINPSQGDTYASAYSPLADPYDVFSANLLGSPVFSSSDANNYSGNRILLYAVAAAAEPTGVHSLTFSKSNNSAIRGASLASIDTTHTPTNILFSRVALTKLLAETNTRVGLEWTLTFT